MMRMIRNRKGFTLMEVLVVLIILGVLAGIAIPIYVLQVEKARSAEALASLGAASQSMKRFFTERGTYVGAVFVGGDPAAVPPTFNLDYNPNLAVGGQVLRFGYVITAEAAGTFTITATRLVGAGLPAIPLGAPAGPHTVTINEAGVVGRTGVYA